MLMSFVMGISNIIPYFGPFIGAIPSILFLLMVSPMQAFWFIVFVLILQQVDGSIIGPKILGDSIGIAPIWVIFSVSFFGGLWGFLGMLIGVPTFALLYSIVKRITEYRLRTKGMDPSTLAYASPEEPLLPGKKRGKIIKLKDRKIKKGK